MSGSMKAIAAVSQNGVIGRQGDLPWRLPEDLKWFKKITMGGILLMGRKTWESLPGALPGRENWVLSRSLEPVGGMRVFRSLEETIRELGDRSLFIMGGGQLYASTLEDCQELYLSEVHQSIADGDAFFPTIWNGSNRPKQSARGRISPFADGSGKAILEGRGEEGAVQPG